LGRHLLPAAHFFEFAPERQMLFRVIPKPATGFTVYAPTVDEAVERAQEMIARGFGEVVIVDCKGRELDPCGQGLADNDSDAAG
jgi:hypothetical protein